MTTNELVSVPIKFYTSFIIPINNCIVYQLFKIRWNFQRFTTISRPIYISDLDISEEDLPTEPDLSYFVEPLSRDIFFVEQPYVSSVPIVDSTHSMKNGYLNALCAITTSDVNPALVNAATYQAYLNLSCRLRIHFPSINALEKCAVCYEMKDNCKCYKFLFTYIQHVKCSCSFGKFGVCVCDDYPEIFQDLDEIRRYQDFVVAEVMSSFGFIYYAEDEEAITFIFFSSVIIAAPLKDYRRDLRHERKLSGFRPP